MKKLVNSETNRSVSDFLDKITNKKRQADARILLKLIEEVSEESPKIWGTSIVGFGKYKYQRKNGDEFEWFNVGFSPGKVHLTVYVMYDINEEQDLLNKLGEHKTGKGCLYIKKLEHIDLEVLRKIVGKSNRWLHQK